jgi:hypothetical protein
MKFNYDIHKYSTDTLYNYKNHILTKKYLKKVILYTKIYRKYIGNVLKKYDSNKQFYNIRLMTFNNETKFSYVWKICSANAI